MVRLERTLNRRVGDKEYHRWRISNIDPEIIQALGWKTSEELTAEVRNGRLVIAPVKE